MNKNNDYSGKIQNEMYAARVKEQNDDFATMVDRDFTIKLTDKQYGNLELMALKAGFKNTSQLLASFVGDLTGWTSNGSDENRMANEWYERAFGTSTEFYAFFRYHCVNYDYHIDDLIFALEDEDIFNEIYQEYLNEYSHNEYLNLDSKDECKKILEEITLDERSQRAIVNEKMFNILNDAKYENIIIARYDEKETRIAYTLDVDCIILEHDEPFLQCIPYRGLSNMVETEESMKFDYVGINWEIPIK